MDLDELKNTWAVLDDKLKKDKMLKETIIKEMLNSKAKQSLSKLINYDVFGLIVCLIGLPFLIFMMGKSISLMTDIVKITAIVMLFIGCFAQTYKIWMLSKINMDQPLSENIRLIHKYNIFIKKEKQITYVFVTFLFLMIIASFIDLGSIDLWRWVCVIALLVFALVMSFLQYKRIYDANINSIKKSIDELAALEENEE